MKPLEDQLKAVKDTLIASHDLREIFADSPDRMERMLNHARNGNSEAAGNILTHQENKFFLRWVNQQLVV